MAGAGGRTTRGGRSSRRWRGGDGRAAARGEALPAAGSRAEEHVREEEEEREGVRGAYLEISKTSEMPKMKVVEFFKLYNIV
jgi:hypothetical protein